MSPKKPAAELPPSDSPIAYCTEKGCLNDAWQNGKCEKHFVAASKGRGTRARGIEPTSAPTPSAPSRKITRAEVESMVIPAMVLLSTIVDESYSPADIVDTPQGKAAKLKPHVDEAITQMTPWFEIYGGAFIKAMPWFGLIGGCVTLVMPAIEPTVEIVAGVRKPRFARKHAGDIYTDEYLAAQNRATQKAKEKRDNTAPAAKQTLEMVNPNSGESKSEIS